MPSAAVVDASVVLKWQLEDEMAMPQALVFRGDFLLHGRRSLAAPSLLAFELTNGILTAVRRGRLARNLAGQALRLLLAAGIRMLPVDPLQVLALSVRWRVSAYEGAYLALAEELDSEAWTGDRAFYTACRKRGSRVRWIGDYPTASR